MNKNVKSLNFIISANTAKLTSGLKKAQARVGGFAKSVNKMTGGFGIALGTYGLIRGISSSIEKFNEQERAIAKVKTALESTGQAAGITLKELENTARSLQKNTLFGDEEILNGATAQLLTFTNIAGANFNRTQKVALDLATVLDQDLKSASIQLGKALNDPVANLSALSRSGIQFSKDQKKLIKDLAESNRLFEAQTVILDELERQYGGQAEAAASAGSGGLKQLQNRFGDIQEQVGAAANSLTELFLPAINSVLDAIENGLPKGDIIDNVLSEIARADIKRVKELKEELESLKNFGFEMDAESLTKINEALLTANIRIKELQGAFIGPPTDPNGGTPPPLKIDPNTGLDDFTKQQKKIVVNWNEIIAKEREANNVVSELTASNMGLYSILEEKQATQIISMDEINSVLSEGQEVAMESAAAYLNVGSRLDMVSNKMNILTGFTDDMFNGLTRGAEAWRVFALAAVKAIGQVIQMKIKEAYINATAEEAKKGIVGVALAGIAVAGISALISRVGIKSGSTASGTLAGGQTLGRNTGNVTVNVNGYVGSEQKLGREMSRVLSEYNGVG